MKYLAVLFLGLAVFSLPACVPKTEFDDQQQKLIEAQTRLRSLQASTADCDKDIFLQLREQAQSLDMLTQELVERNTELSREVARLKVFESQAKAEGQTFVQKLNSQVSDCDAKVERTRATYEDLVKGLKTEISRLKEELEKKKAEASPKPKSKGPKK